MSRDQTRDQTALVSVVQGLGGSLQTGRSGHAESPGVSGPVHPSHRHYQQPHSVDRRGQSDLSISGFPHGSNQDYDSRGQRIHSTFSAACLAQRGPQGALLRALESFLSWPVISMAGLTGHACRRTAAIWACSGRGRVTVTDRSILSVLQNRHTPLGQTTAAPREGAPVIPPTSTSLRIQSDTTRGLMLTDPEPVCRDHKNTPSLDLRLAAIRHSSKPKLVGFLPFKASSSATAANDA